MQVMAKTIAAVLRIEPFNIILQRPLKQLQFLNSALKACVLEADPMPLKSHSNAAAFMESGKVEDLLKTAEEGLFEAILVDRRLKTGDETEFTKRLFR